MYSLCGTPDSRQKNDWLSAIYWKCKNKAILRRYNWHTLALIFLTKIMWLTELKVLLVSV